MQPSSTAYTVADRKWPAAVVAALAISVAGCFGDEDTAGRVDSAANINTAGNIAQASADDYDDNVDGLITAATLQTWIDNWEGNRPAGIDGRLVILQVNADYSNGNPTAQSYITPDPAAGVVTYRIDPGRLTEKRSNGVIYSRSMVPSGAQMDSFLEDYGLDPTEDLIVWAMGDVRDDGSAFPAMQQGRGWYAMRYWGTPRANLAMLNGAATQVMNSNYLGGTATCDESLMDDGDDCLPRSGKVSVRDLPEDNFALQATLEDVVAVAEGRSQAFLWDARSHDEYTARGDTLDDVDFRNDASKQGHPNNAVQLPYGHIMDASDWSYRDKETIRDYLDGKEIDGAQFVRYDGQGEVQPLGEGNAYRDGQTVITYCETTFRAMMTGFASAAILGYPTRFYDGATVEWNSLSAQRDRHGNMLLPADSPWRTDLVTRSHFRYNAPSNIHSRQIDDPYADHTNRILREDRAYKLGDSVDEDDGPGVAPPASPCG